jgi:NAD(P)-dependent dehydrogenase (short-subunit alcohol dehydrogenase family)
MSAPPEQAGPCPWTDPGFLPDDATALVIGASRGIGLAVTEQLLGSGRPSRVIALCRSPQTASELQRAAEGDRRLTILPVDVTDERSLRQAADRIEDGAGRLDLLFNCAGVLHEASGIWPERQLSDIDPAALTRAFEVNARGPLLVFKVFEQLLKRSAGARVATLSARVGSIGDNRLGGWYAYRASKAALNQFVRTTAIQWARLPRPILCVALHPGTVRTDLSAPFAGETYRGKVFEPALAADQLLSVLAGLSPDDSGGFFAWDGQPIPW